MSTVDTALIYLLFAVVGVVGCRLLHLPAILGYLLAGIFLGQGGALIEQSEAAVGSVAELGVVLLDRKSTRLNSSHVKRSRMPSSA